MTGNRADYYIEMMEECIRLSFHELPYVYTADHIFDSKPFIHADRRLNYHVLIYVLRGCIPVVEEGIEYELKPGSLFFLKKGLHHWGDHTVENGSSWIYVHFSLKEAAEEQEDFIPYTSYLQNQEFSMASYRYKVILPKLVRLQNGNLIEDKLLQLADLFHSTNPVRAPYLNLLLEEILLDCYQSGHMLRQVDAADHVTAIIKYMENHTHTSLDRKELEEYMSLSYKHMCFIFKQRTGQTLVEYHTNLRMNENSKAFTGDLASDW